MAALPALKKSVVSIVVVVHLWTLLLVAIIVITLGVCAIVLRLTSPTTFPSFIAGLICVSINSAVVTIRYLADKSIKVMHDYPLSFTSRPAGTSSLSFATLQETQESDGTRLRLLLAASVVDRGMDDLQCGRIDYHRDYSKTAYIANSKSGT